MDAKKALLALQRYCSKAEKCHADIRQKLRDWQIWRADADDIIVALIQDNFLNEQRYANASVHDKFYLQQWGRIKITQHLKQKEISPICIAEALMRIDPESYRATASELALKKAKLLPDELHPAAKRQKIANFLMQRGFEPDLVWQIVQQEHT